MRISFFAKILQIAEIHEIYKRKPGGQVSEQPPFGLLCTDFAKSFFKSHIITKYEKSRNFEVPHLFENIVIAQR